MRHGWYEIPGVQTGDRRLEQQILGLESIDFRGKRILELGCAEGLMSKWLCTERGAESVVGVDSVNDHIERAMYQCAKIPCAFIVHDLNEPRVWTGFDIVLALAVFHKLRKPEIAIATFAQVARESLIVRLPPALAPVIVDDRSKRVPVNADKIITSKGFALREVTKGPFDEWTAHYRRNAGTIQAAA